MRAWTQKMSFNQIGSNPNLGGIVTIPLKRTNTTHELDQEVGKAFIDSRIFQVTIRTIQQSGNLNFSFI